MSSPEAEPLELPPSDDGRRIENAHDARHRLVKPKGGGRTWRVMLRIPGTDIWKLKARRNQYVNRTSAELEEGWIYAD